MKLPFGPKASRSMKLTREGLLIPLKDVPAVWGSLISVRDSLGVQADGCAKCSTKETSARYCPTCFRSLNLSEALEAVADEINRLESQAQGEVLHLLKVAYDVWAGRGMK